MSLSVTVTDGYTSSPLSLSWQLLLYTALTCSWG